MNQHRLATVAHQIVVSGIADAYVHSLLVLQFALKWVWRISVLLLVEAIGSVFIAHAALMGALGL